MQSKGQLNTIDHEVIPEILKVIESHGISALMAEQIPSFLDRAIKEQNVQRMDDVPFKCFGWPKQGYFQSQNP